MSPVLRALSFALLVVFCANCGGGSTPTGPSTPPPPTRAQLSVSMANVTGERAAVGHTYRFQVTVRETGGATATVTSVALVLFRGDGTTGGSTRNSDLPFAPIAASGSGSANWTLDDFSSASYATRLQVTVTYSDQTGSQSATATADVPALPAGPTTFTLCGTVRDGSVPVDAAQVAIVGTARTTLTDGAGRYCFDGLSSGSVTLRVSKSGWDTVERVVNVTGNTTVDVTLVRTNTPPPAQPPTIDSFSADSTSLSSGQSTVIRWSVSNATTVSIDNGIGTVPPTGTRSVSPTFQVNAYRLTASNQGGSVNRTVTISVTNSMICSAAGLPGGTTAVCNNGQYSQSQNRSGTCSQNGGVRCWVCPGVLCQ